MLVKVMSIFNCEAERLYKELKKSKSLIYIARPLIKFVMMPGYEFPQNWVEGKYLVKMYIFGFIPFGSQWIVISIDDQMKHIRDNGYSKLIKKWDHNIYVNNLDKGRTLYLDTIEIKAGILTPIIGLFAHIFYRVRQRNWKKIINNNFKY